MPMLSNRSNQSLVVAVIVSTAFAFVSSPLLAASSTTQVLVVASGQHKPKPPAPRPRPRPPVKGESIDDRHQDEIDILS